MVAVQVGAKRRRKSETQTNREGVASGSTTQTIDKYIYCLLSYRMQIFETIDSTQLEAKRQIDAKGIVMNDKLLALHQTAGITTKKNIPWKTQRGDFNCSYVFHENYYKFQQHHHAEFCSGLAARDTILEICPDLKGVLAIKWPNDILINEKKICGILAEFYKQHIIIGVGLNLISHPDKTEHFPATDLLTETGVRIEPQEFEKILNKHLERHISNLQQYGFSVIRDNWKQSAYMLGDNLILKDNSVVKFKDINDNGCLIVEKEDGTNNVVISSDEVIGGIK